MSRVEVTDEWLYKYMPIVDAAMLRAIESEVDNDYIFSENFERKMKRVIRQEAHMWVGDFMRFARKAAVVVICILAALFALTMSVEAYRTKFFQTVKEIWEDSVIYTYFSEVNEEGFREMEPQYIPEGYSEVSRVYMEDMFSLVYKNEMGDYILYDQVLALDERYNIMDTNFEFQETVKIDDTVAIISWYSNDYVGVFYAEDEFVYILTGNNLTIHEIKNILESIE